MSFTLSAGYALVLPAVGYALFLPAVGYALLTRCGSALLASCHQDHPSVRVSGFTLSCVRSPASLFCECVSLVPRAPYTHRLRSVVPWFAKGLRCSRADPRVLIRTLHVLRVVWCDSAPLASLPSARCCLQAGRELRHAAFVATLVRRWERLVAGASASKVCTLRLSSGFALLCFPRSSTVLLLPLPALCRRSSVSERHSARVCSP